MTIEELVAIEMIKNHLFIRQAKAYAYMMKQELENFRGVNHD